MSRLCNRSSPGPLRVIDTGRTAVARTATEHDAESVVQEGVTSSGFVEVPLRKHIERREFRQQVIVRLRTLRIARMLRLAQFTSIA